MPDSAKDERFLRSSILVFVAHPDDETIGLSERLARLSGSITLVLATDGSPNDPRWAQAAGCANREEYAALRRAEMRQALSLAGFPGERVVELGIADQDAPLRLIELTERARELLIRFQPKFVFTHPYEGGHQDHDALAYACRTALQLVEVVDGAMPGGLLEFSCYHAGEEGFEPLTFLPYAGAAAETVVTLTGEQCQRKRRMMDVYESQKRVLDRFPVDVERFRPAPHYDFLEAPHAGPLYYESHAWAMRGQEFRECVRRAAEHFAPHLHV